MGASYGRMPYIFNMTYQMERLDRLEWRMRDFTQMNEQGHFDWNDFSPHLFWDVDRNALNLPERAFTCLLKWRILGFNKIGICSKSMVSEV